MEIQEAAPAVDGFYTKLLSCDGIPILGTKQVSDPSFIALCSRLSTMLAHQQVARNNLVQHGVELHIAAAGTALSSLPEHPAEDFEHQKRQAYGFCFETPSGDREMLDQCTRQFARSLMLFGFDRKIRNDIQEQFISSRARRAMHGKAAENTAELYWEQISVDYFTIDKQSSTAQDDSQSLSFAKKIYDGLERPRRLEAIRARSASKLALSGQPRIAAQLQFVNNSSHLYRLLSMDANGRLHFEEDLGPYHRVVEETFLDQVWVVQDQRNVEVDRVLVENDLNEYVVAY